MSRMHARTRLVLAGLFSLATLALPHSADAAPPAKTSKASKTSKTSKTSTGGVEIEFPIQTFTLDNGLRVFVVEDHSTPAFNITIMYDVGSRDEVQGRTGFAHFFEHMMFQGSKNMADDDIANNTVRAGGNLNAATSFDQTFYFHNIPSNYLDMVLWGEADRMENLEIEKEPFEVQREAVKSEKDRAENAPQFKIFENLVTDVFAGTPYNHLPIGALDDLNAAQASDAQSFFDTYYNPNNAVMVLVGDVEFANVQDRVTHYYGNIANKVEKKPAPPTGEQIHGKRVDKTVKDSKVKQSFYVWAWPTVPESHPDKQALDMLGTALLGGSSARLPKLLDDEKKLTTGTGGGHAFVLRQAGAMLMVSQPVGDKVALDDIKKLVEAELEKVAKKGLSKKELEKTYNQQLVGTVSTLASNQGRAMSIANGVIGFNDPKHILTEMDSYAKVTNKDIKRVAKQYINSNWFFYELAPEG